MSYRYKNEFEDVYEADVGYISRIKDPESKYNNKLVYRSDRTFNGDCYKDYNTFKKHPNDICYISEGGFDGNDLFVDYVNKNKEKLIKEGVVSTANSIREEVRNSLIYEEYYYEYEKDGIVYTIESKDFDDVLINIIASEVFDIVDWQLTQSFIYENDWKEIIQEYYEEKGKQEVVEL